MNSLSGRSHFGPGGPKWDRPDKLFMVYPRKRWEKSSEWLYELERIFIAKNKKKT